ncbi:hypothetical protein METESE_06890 [Mesoterricola sediminis]|uniref:DUF6036 domain-containing protein n=2 Tax=Mesoterricola sediminis TaxID=2927980 RepID=A0AA48GMC4_9BACT|nr:hypothetical protein METESE_06890 [Mesoterricola sediminis]
MLHVIGSTALMLQSNYVRGTKDSDVLEAADLPSDIAAELLALAGRGTSLAARHQIYLDIVPRGLPFLPLAPVWHSLRGFSDQLVNFQVESLDIVDVTVSKLKRFNLNDQADVRAMVERGMVSHDELVERFKSAVDRFSGDARAYDLPKCVRNLNQVERDLFLEDGTEIELPDWI